MKSLKNKLVTISIFLVAIPVCLSIFISNYYMNKNLRPHIHEDHNILSNTIANGVADYMTKAYALTEELISNDYVREFNAEKQNLAVKDAIKRNPYFDLFCIQNMKGDQTARSRGHLANRADRWWFKQSVKTKKPFVSKSYLTVNDNSEAINSIIFPIIDNKGQMRGVMDADLKLDELQKMVEKYSTDNTYAYVIDGNGAVIAHPNKEKVQEIYNYKTLQKTVRQKDSSGKVIKDKNDVPVTKTETIEVVDKLKEIVGLALTGKHGIVEYKDKDGEKVISSYGTINLPGDSDNWAVITTQKEKDAFAMIYDIRNRIMIVGFIVLLLAIILSYIVSARLIKPLTNLSELTQRAAKGDLTVKSDYHSEDEIGALSISFNNMIDNMKALIFNIKEVTEVVTNATESLLASTQQTSSSINEVAESMTNVAVDIEKGSENAKDGVKSATDLSKELDSVSKKIVESEESSKNVYNISNNGFEVIRKLEEKNERSSVVSREVTEVINSLSEKANNIGTIVETINSISEETNLLALNAAIEAARAGEAGKGFSVVAEEVRKLSENTAESTNNVKSIISNIQKDIKLAQGTIKQIEEVGIEQNEAVNITKDTFKEINTSIEGIVEKINTISESLFSVDSCKTNLISVVEQVSFMAEGVAEATQNVCGATEEQNAEMEQISALAEDLNNMTQKLIGEVKSFKIE
ncbi:hypothetical protein RS78_06240 [Clostridium tetani]|nr:hypothetical protein KY52_12510 [Clostridium tetani]KGI40514.1 hypothetical protein LA33_07695 [Clostridium tetani ATCC 9441]KGI42306.1 hypothetical protein KY55_09445 [Clostridium tetani]KGI46197.1 hypothetical protein KY54_00940 [Clostridium tetani]KHO36483.1 hypothetical protein OR63_04205 [Clostridium tetani]